MKMSNIKNGAPVESVFLSSVHPEKGKAMTPQDEQMIQQASFPKTDPPPTIVQARDGGDAGVQMNLFCSRLKELAPGIKIKNDSDIPFPAPVLVVGRHQNIGYQAALTGKMLAYFLEALDSARSDAAETDPQVDDLLNSLDMPVILKLYVASQCPHCPQSIRQLQSLAARTPLVRLRIIEAEHFSQDAQADQIRSVPTLILDDQYRWSGLVKTEELLSLCILRDPSQMSAGSLRQMIETGEADRVAAMMVAAEKLFPALAELLIHDRWSVRLGAMVTAEYLADEAPALSLELCRSLWKSFPGLAPQVQGDVVQVLGQVDTAVTRDYLHCVQSGDFDEEVKTVAAEVLEEMGDS
jgi:glutaredoxin